MTETPSKFCTCYSLLLEYLIKYAVSPLLKFLSFIFSVVYIWICKNYFTRKYAFFSYLIIFSTYLWIFTSYLCAPFRITCFCYYFCSPYIRTCQNELWQHFWTFFHPSEFFSEFWSVYFIITCSLHNYPMTVFFPHNYLILYEIIVFVYFFTYFFHICCTLFP